MLNDGYIFNIFRNEILDDVVDELMEEWIENIKASNVTR